MSFKTKLYLAIAASLIIIYGAFRLLMYDYVQPHQIGIWMTNGGYQETDYQVWQGSFPIDVSHATKSFKLPGQPYSVDMKADTVYSRQKGEWTIDPEYTFKVDRNQAVKVCFRNNNLLSSGNDEKFFESVSKYLLNKLVKDVFNETIGKSNDSLLMANTWDTQKTIEDSVRVRFSRVGYDLENFASNLNPPATVIAKNRAKNEAEATTLASRSKVLEAEANAKIAVATANADAQVAIIEAKAAAEVTKLEQQAKTQNLNSLLIQKEWIAKWNGALPVNMYGGGQNLFQIPVK
jgi:regulator of protease activity HflC (stomatin/prohibitin superfamily)